MTARRQTSGTGPHVQCSPVRPVLCAFGPAHPAFTPAQLRELTLLADDYHRWREEYERSLRLIRRYGPGFVNDALECGSRIDAIARTLRHRFGIEIAPSDTARLEVARA